jgi:hypothetical protein
MFVAAVPNGRGCSRSPPRVCFWNVFAARRMAVSVTVIQITLGLDGCYLAVLFHVVSSQWPRIMFEITFLVDKPDPASICPQISSDRFP